MSIKNPKFAEIVEGIKSLQIQGAEKIAVAATEAFAIALKETADKQLLTEAANELIATRETEPALRNAVTYCLNNCETNPNVVEYVLNHFQTGKEKIIKFGAEKIKDGFKIFTHCHSSSVENIIIEAHKQGKKIEVYNTETRPKFQGRLTATNLAAAGIEVKHFVDSAGRTYLKECDIFLFGCDAISSDGRIYNKIGTQNLVEFAHDLKIPVYSVTNSWKLDPKTLEGAEEEIEMRAGTEVWPEAPSGVTILNPAFEIVSPEIVDGIITELGIIKPETLLLEVQKNYPFLF